MSRVPKRKSQESGWYTSNTPGENSKEVGLFSKEPKEEREWSLDGVLRGLNQLGGLALFLLGFYRGTFLGDLETGTYYLAMGLFLMGFGGGFR